MDNNPLPLDLAADEMIRAIKAGEPLPKEMLRAFILRAHSQHEENRKTRIKEEAKKLKPDDINFF